MTLASKARLNATTDLFLWSLQRLLIALFAFSCVWLLVCQNHINSETHAVDIHESAQHLANVDSANLHWLPLAPWQSEKRSLQIDDSSKMYDSKQNEIHIILCSDEQDRLPMYTLINSIIQNEPDLHRLNFHILVLDNKHLFQQEFQFYFERYLHRISYEFKSILDDNPECIEYNNIVSKTLPEKQARNWLNNVMNFARFCAPNVFRDVEVALYMDVDMIVQNRISLLFDEYYAKHSYAAWSVMNRSPYKTTFKNEQRAAFLNDYLNLNLSALYPSIASRPLNLSNVQHIFNAGILMFDFGVWRRNNFTQQSMELFRFNTIFSHEFHRKPWTGVTQPILNMLFIINEIRVADFGKSWNFVIKDLIRGNRCNGKLKEAEKQSLRRQNVLHWAGGCKPWTSSQANTAYLWLKYIPQSANLSQWENEFNVSFS